MADADSVRVSMWHEGEALVWHVPGITIRSSAHARCRSVRVSSIELLTMCCVIVAAFGYFSYCQLVSTVHFKSPSAAHT